ncbi:MAG: DUF1499 domain-containing protein [Rhizobiaceae bacterium]
MAAMIERRVSTAARWSRRLALFSATLLLTSGCGHRYGAVDTISLFWLLGIVATLALVAVLLSGLGFLQLWEFGDRGGRNSTKGLLVALLVLAPFAYGAIQALTLPSLTDVSTDLVDPPTFFHACKARHPRMNPLLPFARGQADVQIAYYPEITGRRYPLAMDSTLDITRAVVDQLGWSPLGPVRTGAFGSVMTLEVAAPSPWVGIVSDATIRLIDEGEAIYVDVRSASRYGLHDLGGNAARINRFFAAVEDEIAARNAFVPVPPAE